MPTASDIADPKQRAIQTERLREFYDKAFGSEVLEPVAIHHPHDGQQRIIFLEAPTVPGILPITFDKHFVDHVILQHTIRKRETFASYALPTIQNPAEIYLQATRQPVQKGLFDLVYLAKFGDMSTVLVVRELPGIGGVAWTFFPIEKKQHYDNRRQGLKIYPPG